MTVTTPKLSTIAVKEEEDVQAIATCSTPLSSPVVTAETGQHPGLQLATTKMPLEFNMYVDSIASVVSSTGLSKQKSLQIANEAVLRRLDYQVVQADLIQNEARKEKLEEARREEDKKDAERRHEESLKAIKGEKGLAAKAMEARRCCTETAFHIFPGGHFLICVSLALVSMFLCLNFASLIQGMHMDEANRTGMNSLLHICGCLDEGYSSQAGSEVSQYSGPLISYLRFATDLCPSSIHAYLFAPVSRLVESTTCFVWCALKYVGLLAALGFTHRILRLFHSHGFVHQAINVSSISGVLLATLVKQSPSHATSTALLMDITIPILITNIIIMSTMWGLSIWAEGLGDDSFRRAERENEEALQRKLRLFTRLPKVGRFASLFVALGVGIYWGMR